MIDASLSDKRKTSFDLSSQFQEAAGKGSSNQTIRYMLLEGVPKILKAIKSVIYTVLMRRSACRG